MAARERLHVVEFRKEMDDIPLVVASPDGPTRQDAITDPTFDFENMYYDNGKVGMQGCIFSNLLI